MHHLKKGARTTQITKAIKPEDFDAQNLCALGFLGGAKKSKWTTA